MTPFLSLIVSALVSHMAGHITGGLIPNKASREKANQDLLKWLDQATKP